MKESTRYGRLSPHSAPIEVGPHPRRIPPDVWSDLDRSTVWAETALSSRLLHVILSRDTDAADKAIRCGCHLSNSSVKATVRSHFASLSANIGAPPSGPNGSSHCILREMTPTSDGFIRRIYILGQSHVKESTRSGHLSPHSAPIEVGPHPRRLPRCPLESSNGAPHRMRSQRHSLSFIGEAPAAQLRRRMTTDPYVTTHFFKHSHSTHLGALYYTTAAA